MKKNRMFVVFALVVSTLCAQLGSAAISDTVVEGNTGERPLAGLAISFDRYCDEMVAEVTKAENEDESSESQDISAQEAASGDMVAQSGEGTVEGETSLSTTSSTPAPTQAPVKLNLVYDRLGIANVENYLNVRKKPSEDAEIVGKMTKNNGCNVYSIENGWAKIVSGKVNGYVKAEFLVTDQEAEALAQKVATRRAVVTTETLNTRWLPSTNAKTYDQISADEDYTITQEHLTKEYIDDFIRKNMKSSQLEGINLNEMYADLGNWVQIALDDEKAFVSKDFINMTYNLNRAVVVKKDSDDSSSDSSTGGGSVGSRIINYAMKFLGNRYVWGGTSLTHGTDCSGFTMRVFQHFGYSLPRVSGAQANATRRVKQGHERVGDLFFYGSGSVSHVAIYMGHGQIIHASNRRDGIKISNAYYRKPLKIGRILK